MRCLNIKPTARVGKTAALANPRQAAPSSPTLGEFDSPIAVSAGGQDRPGRIKAYILCPACRDLIASRSLTVEVFVRPAAAIIVSWASSGSLRGGTTNSVIVLRFIPCTSMLLAG